MSVLVYCEQKNGKVTKPSLGALHLAKLVAGKQGGGYNAVVVGRDVAAAAAELAKYGVNKVYTVGGEGFEPFVSEAHAAAVLAAGAACGATFYIAVATNNGKDMLPRVAVGASAGMVSEITGFDAESFAFERPIFAGKLTQTVVIDSAVQAVTVRGTAFEPLVEQGTAAPVEALTVDAVSVLRGKRFLALHETKSDRPELTEAAVVVSGGRSLKSTQGFEEYVYPLADLLGAAVGATRAAVDSGYVPNDMQVGQTGKVVAPQLYFAVGISGAIQHLAGMKDSKVIVAINKDPEAPIFGVADYGLVADLYKAVPELIDEIKRRRG